MYEGITIHKIQNGWLVVTPENRDHTTEQYSTVFKAAMDAQKDDTLSKILEQGEQVEDTPQPQKISTIQTHWVFATLSEALSFIDVTFNT